MKKELYLGLDVHKDCIAAAVAILRLAVSSICIVRPGSLIEHLAALRLRRPAHLDSHISDLSVGALFCAHDALRT
jgi:hypothetical protein